MVVIGCVDKTATRRKGHQTIFLFNRNLPQTHNFISMSMIKIHRGDGQLIQTKCGSKSLQCSPPIRGFLLSATTRGLLFLRLAGFVFAWVRARVVAKKALLSVFEQGLMSIKIASFSTSRVLSLTEMRSDYFILLEIMVVQSLHTPCTKTQYRNMLQMECPSLLAVLLLP